MAAPKIIVVGGGLAGLSAVIKIAEMGGNVDLFSIVPVKRSHSVCAQGGINAAKNLKGEGDSTWKHFDDTVYGGDFLANQPPVKDMCEAAPGIIDLLDRMGVPFNRTPEGLLDFRRFGGTLYNRTAFAGATTGQQLLYALDEQVRRYESEGKVKKYEHWEFLSAVLDGNRVCRGICAMDLRSMEVRTFPADAIIIATGGNGAIFGKSTNSVVCTGSAQSALYQQGCFLRQRRIYSGASHLHSGRRQAAVDVGVGARRRRTRLGSEDARRQARSEIDSGERALVLSGRVVSEIRQPGAARYRDARHLQSCVRAQPRHRRQADGLSRPDAHRPQDSRQEAGRHSRNLREVCRRRSARHAHEDFPRHALHHGRAVDRLQAGNEHPRHFRGGRVRISVSRRESAGREFAGVLHLRRSHRRAERGEIRARIAGAARRQRMLRGRAQEAGRKQRPADE